MTTRLRNSGHAIISNHAIYQLKHTNIRYNFSGKNTQETWRHVARWRDVTTHAVDWAGKEITLTDTPTHLPSVHSEWRHVMECHATANTTWPSHALPAAVRSAHVRVGRAAALSRAAKRLVPSAPSYAATSTATTEWYNAIREGISDEKWGGLQDTG